MTPEEIFKKCVNAINSGSLIKRVSISDKEFHFQNWFESRLEESKANFENAGRNTYPDFRMVASTEGYEVKGLAYPGRIVNFDSNSQVPTGHHNGRTIYYVFGRYPAKPDGNKYPVLDLVICHGDFLNPDHDYIHKNKSVKGFGVYGDIMIRDRKMYVVPTPFGLLEGASHHHTLILPKDMKVGKDFVEVGELKRTETEKVVIGYTFNLQTNELAAKTVPNPNAGRAHVFKAWRVKGAPESEVSMRHYVEDELSEIDNDE